MSFRDSLKAFVFRTERLTRTAYVDLATRVHASIKGDDSGQPDPITGAPGQPVDTGTLKGSWVLAIGPNEATISTNVAHAEAIENGIGPFGPLTLRSAVGGFHSVKQTIAGASALQADVVRRLG